MVHRRAWLLMAILAALWGASYLFIKVALDDLSPVALVFVRTALGALVLAPVAARRGAFAAARRHLGTLALVAAIQIAGPFLLIAAGEQSIPSSLAGILVASPPIWTALLARAFVPSERLRGWGLGGLALGIVRGAGLLGRLRRDAARRGVRRGHGGRARPHPRRLVAGRRRADQPKRTFPFDRARSCARSMKSSRLAAARNRRSTRRIRAFSERSSSRPCLASRPKSTVAAIA